MRLAIVMVLALTACAAPDPLADTRPINCQRFKTQAEAQSFYEAHHEHWWTLDPDRNGNACDHGFPEVAR
jgi:hypothetical protein